MLGFGWLAKLLRRGRTRGTATVNGQDFEYENYGDAMIFNGPAPAGASVDDVQDAMIRSSVGDVVEKGDGCVICENAQGIRTRVMTFPKWATKGGER